MNITVVAKPGFKVLNNSAHSSCALLYRGVQETGVKVIEWSATTMLFSRYHILHIHWPDNILSGSNAYVVSLKMAALFASLGFVRVFGKRVVWTAHNLSSHEQRHRVLEKVFWRLFPLFVDGVCAPMHWIAEKVRELPSFGSVRAVAVTPFGSWTGCYTENREYTDELRNSLSVDTKKGIVLWLGYLRRYKGVETLIEVFGESRLSDCLLVLAGKCEDRAYEKELSDQAVCHSNIRTEFRFIPDKQIASLFQIADVCVLPFTKVTNSGSARLALSFGKHVLMPEHPLAKEFRCALGDKWISTYSPSEGLTSEHIVRALNDSRQIGGDVVNWKDYNWTNCANRTVELYKSLI